MMGKWIILLFGFVMAQGAMGAPSYRKQPVGVISQKGQSIAKSIDSFFDPNFNYSIFSGRVTDRDNTSSILKISSEYKNIKFFRSGDLVEFNVARLKTSRCQGYVRSVEKNYFVIFVKDLFPCWKEEEYFRRGTLLNFTSTRLAKRVKDASLYRVVLLRRRKDFFKQLNDVNHFIWSYDQQRMLVASDYDKKIVEIEKAKQRALEMLLVKRKDQINLQRELTYRLDQLDKDLDFYRIDRDDLLVDRWHLDHDQGLPLGRRPQKMRARNSGN